MKSVLPAEVELVRPVQVHAPVGEQARQRAVHDRRPDLALDVVPHDRQPRLLEAARPVAILVPRDEDGDAVDERAARRQRLLHVPLRRLFGADRQVVDDDVDVVVAKQLHDVGRAPGRLLDHVAQVLAQPVVRHPALHLHARVRNVGELVGVVLPGEHRLGQVLADLVGVDVDRHRHVDVVDVIAPRDGVHDPGNLVPFLNVPVKLQPLHE